MLPGAEKAHVASQLMPLPFPMSGAWDARLAGMRPENGDGATRVAIKDGTALLAGVQIGQVEGPAVGVACIAAAADDNSVASGHGVGGKGAVADPEGSGHVAERPG